MTGSIHAALLPRCLPSPLAPGCGSSVLPVGLRTAASRPAPGRPLTIGVAFETLQTEFWVAALDAFRAEIAKRGIKMMQAIADGDANRQLDQVRTSSRGKVDGIILVPKDAKTCIPIIKAANAAGIPIVLFNRPPDKSDAALAAVVADNFALTKETVAYMIGRRARPAARHKAMILIGDLGDINAIGRRDGFDAAVRRRATPSRWWRGSRPSGTRRRRRRAW